MTRKRRTIEVVAKVQEEAVHTSVRDSMKLVGKSLKEDKGDILVKEDPHREKTITRESAIGEITAKRVMKSKVTNRLQEATKDTPRLLRKNLALMWSQVKYR